MKPNTLLFALVMLASGAIAQRTDNAGMNKMMSGMSASDKSEMKMMMDRMMALPPSERVKAMQNMGDMSQMHGSGDGMGERMGGMNGMMKGMSTSNRTDMQMMMGRMMSMQPSDRMSAMHKMSGHSMGGMTHSGMGTQSMGTSGMEALNGVFGKEYNVGFLSQMIAHHQGAIVMAQQALRIAKRDETKREARLVIAEQRSEIDQMTGWLRKWYGISPSKQQAAMMNADMKNMMEMRVDNDRMFYTMMIPHHQGAIEMSRMSAQQSDKEEVKRLSRNIIKAQKTQIEHYNGILSRFGN